MSNILRSSIFIRQLCGKHALTGVIKHARLTAFSTSDAYRNISTTFPLEQQHNVDRYIRKLDQDARRAGRVSRNEVENVVKVIKNSRSASSTQSLMIIRCCGNLISDESPEKRTELVQNIWDTFDKLGVPIDISHYNALLRVYIENEHKFSPGEFLAMLEKKGIKPNRVTFQRLITRYCQSGDIAGATKILEHMKENELPINDSVFNALILGHSQAGDMESAEGVLNLMKQAGLEANSETYTILICGHIKKGNIDKMHSIIKDCENKDIYFNDKDYLEMLHELALHDREDQLDFIFGKFRKSAGFNQEAINYVHRLVGAGKAEIAYKVLKSMIRLQNSQGEFQPSGAFFISSLIRQQLPIETILKYVDLLKADGLHPDALSIAMEASLRFCSSSDKNITIELFKEAAKRGYPIRQHYFWPLILMNANAGRTNETLEILRIMEKEFKMPANTETVREIVVPALIKYFSDLNEFMLQLRSCGITVAAAASSIVVTLLKSNRTQEAAEIAKRYRAYYAPFVIKRPLIGAFIETRDISSFVTILKHIALGIQWFAGSTGELDKNLEGLDIEDTIPDQKEIIGSFLLSTVNAIKTSTNRNEIQSLFQALVSGGMGVSNDYANKIQNVLQGILTEETLTLLEKLVETNEQLSYDIRPPSRNSYTSLDERTLLKLREMVEEKGESTLSIRKQLFHLYCRKNDYENAIKIKEDLEADGIELSLGMQAYLIDLYAQNDKLEEALATYNEIISTDSDFVLDDSKILSLAALAVKHDQIDKAIELLQRRKERKSSVEEEENVSYMNTNACWRILNVLAEKGNVYDAKRILDILAENGFIVPNNTVLGPIIKAYIVNDNYAAALDEFENIAMKYKATPWKNELALKFIETEDASSLQRLTDLNTQVHGEVNSLYDLMLAFLESGRVKQAKKILETPGLRLRQDRLQNASSRYQIAGAVEHLENLLEITKDIPSVNRSELYLNLLITLSRADDVEKASALWTQLQEEDVQPSDRFLVILADVLKRHDLDVPFVEPTIDVTAIEITSNEPQKLSPFSIQLRKLVDAGDLDAALKLKESVTYGKFTKSDLSYLLEELVRVGRMSEARKIVTDMLLKGSSPSYKSLKSYTMRCGNSGQIDALKDIEHFLNDETKKRIQYDNNLCRAYTIAGRANEYVETLKKKLESAKTDEEFLQFTHSFPRAGLTTLINKNPELIGEIEKINNECIKRDKDNVFIANSLWIHFFVSNDYDNAERIWDKYLKDTDNNIIFNTIVRDALTTANTTKLEKLLQAVKTKKNFPNSLLGYIYGSLIKLHVQLYDVEGAIRVFEKALETISVDDFGRTVIEELKYTANAKNIPFNHPLPSRKKRVDELQSSDSDDEYHK